MVMESVRSALPVGATVLMNASAVGPHFPSVSKTTFAFAFFAGLSGCRVVVRVGVCMLWTLAHSVGYADVNESMR